MRLYPILLIGALIAVLAMDLGLTAAHVLRLHRRAGSRPAFRVAGWLLTGLTVGLITLLMMDAAVAWLGIALAGAWPTWWAWRQGRLADLGLALTGGAIPWIVAYVFFLAVFPADPLTQSPDRRFFVLVAGVLVAALGVMLTIATPRTAARRPLTAMDRARRLLDAVEREQAMGPFPAPAVLALLAAFLAGILTLLTTRGLGLPAQLALTGIVFDTVAIPVWLAATPRRVARAHATLNWLVGLERRSWHTRLGRPLPRTISGARNLLDSMGDVPALLPLRVELLATFGRTAEARTELERLVATTPTQEAERAELAAYVAWCEGTTDLGAIDALCSAIDRIADPDERTHYRVALALARTRADIVAGRDDAIDHLVAVHPEVGSGASALASPYGWAIIGLFVAVGAFTTLAGIMTGLAPGQGVP